MKKEEKVILKHLIKKEIKCIKSDENSIEFPSLKFLKSTKIYEDELKKLLVELK